MHQTVCKQTVAVSFEAETNPSMAFETYGNPWYVRESTMNDTVLDLAQCLSFNSFMCSFCLFLSEHLLASMVAVVTAVR